jgi:hypothetical protein
LAREDRTAGGVASFRKNGTHQELVAVSGTMGSVAAGADFDFAKPGKSSPQTVSPAAAIATTVHVSRWDRSSFGISSIR